MAIAPSRRRRPGSPAASRWLALSPGLQAPPLPPVGQRHPGGGLQGPPLPPDGQRSLGGGLQGPPLPPDGQRHPGGGLQ